MSTVRRVTIPIYTSWVVEFDFYDSGEVHMHRYDTSEPRPHKPTEYINESVFRVLAVIMIERELGAVAKEHLIKKWGLEDCMSRVKTGELQF